MTEEQLETLATEEQTENAVEVQEDESQPEESIEQPEAETEEQPVKEEPIDEEKVRLREENSKLQGRVGAVNGDKKLVARALKSVLDEYGIGFDEVAAKVGVKPEDLRSRVERAEIAENPVEVAVNEFNQLYVGAGVKETLDDVYGEDTQQYVAAFDKFAKAEDGLLDEFVSLDPVKRPAYVVKQGKALLEKQKSTKSLADEVAELKAKLAAYETGKAEVKEERKAMPLSGAPKTSSMVGVRVSGLAESIFN